MARVWRFFAARGLDVLIVLAAAGGAVGTLLRDDADKPAGVQLWLEVVAVACIPLLLLGRRRWPLVAPAAWKIFSRTTVPWTSFAPKCRAICAIGRPIMIQ